MKVLVCGFGVMGKNHVRVLAASNQISEVLVFDPTIKKDSKSNYRKVSFLSSIQEGLASAPSYAIVAAPTDEHYSICFVLAKAQIPTLVEKPFAVNTKQRQEINSFYEQMNTILAIGFVERFNPVFQKARSLLSQGMVGDISFIVAQRLSSNPGRNLGVGVMQDLGSHDLDLITWLMKSQITDFHNVQSGTPVAQSVLTCGKLDNGAIFQISASWESPRKHRSLQIFGTKGALYCDSLGSELRLVVPQDPIADWDNLKYNKGNFDTEELKYSLSVSEPLVEEHESFRRYLVSKLSGDLCMPSEAIRNLRVLDEEVGIR
jgi:predicted dehydrogenase